MAPLGIGLIGCGNISEVYLQGAGRFGVLRMVGCADVDPAAATAKAAAHGLPAMTIAALLDDPAVDIILNLTTPQNHVPVALQAIAKGKHVYSEKPLAVDMDSALALQAAATAAGLRVGSAPDTFLGGVHQTARAALDAGLIGRVVAGSAHMQVPGHELWHPNPDFYYQPGGGPMMDMGPYYLTCLVNMIGPVRAVTGAAATAHATRTIASGPRAGQTVAVAVPTHISGILDFANGAQVTITTSFDVWKHGHNHIELYGTTGAMIVPDPNWFQGEVMAAAGKGDWQALPQAHGYGDGNHRILGLADMAQAILAGRPHRASLGLALHVLEIMTALAEAAAAGRRIDLRHPCDRPAAMPAGLATGTID